MQRASLLSVKDFMPVIPLLAGAWVRLPNKKMMGVSAGNCWLPCTCTVSTCRESLKLAVAEEPAGETNDTLPPSNTNPVPERVMTKVAEDGSGTGDVMLIFKIFDLSRVSRDMTNDDSGSDLSGYMTEDVDCTMLLAEFMRLMAGTDLADETLVFARRGHKGLGRVCMENVTSTPGGIANGEYTCRMPLLKWDQPVQNALGGITSSVLLPGVRHFNFMKSSPVASTKIAKNG